MCSASGSSINVITPNLRFGARFINYVVEITGEVNPAPVNFLLGRTSIADTEDGPVRIQWG